MLLMHCFWLSMIKDLCSNGVYAQVYFFHLYVCMLNHTFLQDLMVRSIEQNGMAR